jgi:hypothetical protein
LARKTRERRFEINRILKNSVPEERYPTFANFVSFCAEFFAALFTARFRDALSQAPQRQGKQRTEGHKDQREIRNNWFLKSQLFEFLELFCANSVSSNQRIIARDCSIKSSQSCANFDLSSVNEL